MWSICGLRSGFKMFNIFLAKLNKPNYIFALLVNYKIFVLFDARSYFLFILIL